MADESFEEKTEAPSEKRRHDARVKGNVAKSTEVNSALVLLAALFMLRIAGPKLISDTVGVFHKVMDMIANPVMTDASVVGLTAWMIVFMIKATMPIMGAILAVGIFANVIQIGFLITGDPLIPKLEKINPLAGFKRLFSARSLVELAKSIVKLGIIGTIAYVTIKDELPVILGMGSASIAGIGIYLFHLTLKVLFRCVLAFLVLAILDYAYQRFDHERKLKMTRQEVKEERKQLEGDPLIKSRIRSLQREMARRRMMKEVPKATVVVTNPTYIAIALRYEAAEMEAPVVVAKGKRLIAEQIRNIAREHNIPIYEDKPLARAMYDKVEIGGQIPIEFFAAVAEILAYVYRLKNRQAA